MNEESIRDEGGRESKEWESALAATSDSDAEPYSPPPRRRRLVRHRISGSTKRDEI
jgi:hypothetical protein